jgi:hypothetical protein
VITLKTTKKDGEDTKKQKDMTKKRNKVHPHHPFIPQYYLRYTTPTPHNLTNPKKKKSRNKVSTPEPRGTKCQCYHLLPSSLPAKHASSQHRTSSQVTNTRRGKDKKAKMRAAQTRVSQSSQQ